MQAVYRKFNTTAMCHLTLPDTNRIAVTLTSRHTGLHHIKTHTHLTGQSTADVYSLVLFLLIVIAHRHLCLWWFSRKTAPHYVVALYFISLCVCCCFFFFLFLLVSVWTHHVNSVFWIVWQQTRSHSSALDSNGIIQNGWLEACCSGICCNVLWLMRGVINS